MQELKYSVIVMEHQEDISHLLCRMLKQNGYKVDNTSITKVGINMIASQCPDLVIMDADMPDMDGKSVLLQLRNWMNCCVIVISAKSSIADKVELLEAGADDYLTKPFSLEELLARIHTCLRRKRFEAITPSYQKDNLTINFERRQVLYYGQEMHFTPVEYRILEHLAINSGKIISYSELLHKIWGPYYQNADNRILRVNMANIRHKIEEDPKGPHYIMTEAGVGYRMMESDKDVAFAG